MKKLLIVALSLSFLFCFPGIMRKDCHHAFDSFEQQVRFYQIQAHHGACAVAVDFSQFIRFKNGEICRLNRR